MAEEIGHASQPHPAIDEEGGEKDTMESAPVLYPQGRQRRANAGGSSEAECCPQAAGRGGSGQFRHPGHIFGSF